MAQQTSQELVTPLFLQLVQLDSPSGHEQKVSAFLEIWLEEQGFTWKKDSIGNLHAFRSGMGEPLLFCAHMDTVQKKGDQVIPQVKDGVISSDGSTILGADNKASMAAILLGVKKYLSESLQPRAIELLFTVREETGGGVEHLPSDWIISDYGYIFDIAQPLGTIATDGLHIINFEVKIHGKGSHPSHPEEGLNVGTKVLELLQYVPQGKTENGDTFINLGVILVGTKDKINIIPGEAVIQGEIRSFNKVQFDTWLQDIESFVAKNLNKDGYSAQFTTNGYAPGYSISHNEKVITKAVGALQNLGIPVDFYRSSGVSDSNPLIAIFEKKIVTLSDGIQNPHSTSESVTEQNLQDLAKLVAELLVG